MQIKVLHTELMTMVYGSAAHENIQFIQPHIKMQLMCKCMVKNDLPTLNFKPTWAGQNGTNTGKLLIIQYAV